MSHWKQEKKQLEEENAKLKADIEAAKVGLAVVEPPVVEEKKESVLSGRPPTKPWEKKDGVYRPFRRDFFKLKKAHKGFRPYFANESRVEDLLERGYRIADPEHYGGLTDRVMDDGSPLGKRIVRHKMVLMEIPLEDYMGIQKAKDEHRKALMSRSKQEVKTEAEKVGSEIGHKVVMKDDSK